MCIYRLDDRLHLEYPKSPSDDSKLAITQRRDTTSREINQWLLYEQPLDLQASEIQFPVKLSSSQFAQISFTSDKRVKEMQIHAYDKVTLLLEGGQEVVVAPDSLNLLQTDNSKLAEYLKHSHFVVTEFSDSSYKMTANLCLLGGGGGQSKAGKQARVPLLGGESDQSKVQAHAANISQVRNETPYPDIHWAALNDDIRLMQEVLRNQVPHRYSVDVLAEPHNLTALQIACLNQNWQIVKLLVKAGADVNRPVISELGYEFHPGATIIYEAHRSRTQNARIKLITKASTMMDIPLGCFCIANSRDEELSKMVIDAGAKGNVLFSAASKGLSNIVEYIISRGVDDIDAIHTRSGLTPLEIALEKGHLSTAKILLNHGADPQKIKISVYKKLSEEARGLLPETEAFKEAL